MTKMGGACTTWPTMGAAVVWVGTGALPTNMLKHNRQVREHMACGPKATRAALRLLGFSQQACMGSAGGASSKAGAAAGAVAGAVAGADVTGVAVGEAAGGAMMGAICGAG